MLVFVAPDQNTINVLRQEVRRYLAWLSIRDDKDILNLDAAQNRETENNLNRSNTQIEAQIREVFCHLLVPYIDRAVDLKQIIWDSISIRGGDDGILVKTARKMQQNELLVSHWAPTMLQMELDNLHLART